MIKPHRSMQRQLRKKNEPLTRPRASPTWQQDITQLLNHDSLLILLCGFLSAGCAMVWAKYQRDTWFHSSYLGYVLWISLTRCGDAFLIYYPWSRCRPDLFTSRHTRHQILKFTLVVVLSESVFFLAPANKTEWEQPECTSSIFRVLVTGHFLLYFVGFFLMPYYYSFTSSSSDGHLSRAQQPVIEKSVDTRDDDDDDVPGSPSKSKTQAHMRPSRSFSQGSRVLRSRLASFVRRENQSPHAHLAGVFTLSYSLCAICLPYHFPHFSIFAYSPSFFVPVLVLLFVDRNKDISRHHGYCMLFTIFQLGIHALPSFMLNTLLRVNNTTGSASGSSGSSHNIIAAVLYYAMMAGYGQQWRLVAFNATTEVDHAAILSLFQVIDVIFSNLVFLGVQRFDDVNYWILVSLTFCRIFLRDSKWPNDFWSHVLRPWLGHRWSDLVSFGFHIHHHRASSNSESPDAPAILQSTNLTSPFPNPIMSSKTDPTHGRDTTYARAKVQCTRIRRARMNFGFELLASLLLPTLSLVDLYTGWGILTPVSSSSDDTENDQTSVTFILLSALLLCTTRLVAGISAWMYLKAGARNLVRELEGLVQHKSRSTVEKPNETPPPPTSLLTIVTHVLEPEAMNDVSLSNLIQFQPVADHHHHHHPDPHQGIELLFPESSSAQLRQYLATHHRYICVCVMYGIFNAIIFIGKINGGLDRIQMSNDDHARSNDMSIH